MNQGKELSPSGNFPDPLASWEAKQTKEYGYPQDWSKTAHAEFSL